MKTLKFNKKLQGTIYNEITLSPESWEKFKQMGDKELYLRLNGYADYEELRIYIESDRIDMESHSIKEEK